MAPSGELKTKPTQHSVAALRSIGITPDALILRCDRDVPEPLKNKIALMCDVDIDGVISTPDAPSIYDIPKVLHREELDAYVVRRLNLPFRDVDWTQWDDLLHRVHEPQETVRIALVGKYIDLSDAYLSVAEALRAGGFKHRAKVEMRWVASDDCETESGAAAALDDVHGVLIPGGFGIRGIEGKIGAIRIRAHAGLPVLRALPRIAVHRDRSGALGRAHRGQLRGVRSEDPRPGHLHDGRPARGRRRRGRPRRHHAAGRLPGGAGAGFHCGAGIRIDRECPSGTGTATRSTTPTVIASPRAGCDSAGRRRTGTWSSSSSTPPTCTRSSSVRRRTPSSRAGRPGRIRCSSRSSARRWTTRRRSDCPGWRFRSRRTESSSRGGRATAARCRAANLKPVAEHDFETVASETIYIGKIFALRIDQVRMPGGNVAKREVVENFGAVAIVAMDEDDTSRWCTSTGTRSARRLWELPAGLLDVGGEAPHLTAARELHEEVGLAAKTGGCWSTSIPRRASATRGCGSTWRPV